jgi:F-type H+-transporting ATPase subunit delta
MSQLNIIAKPYSKAAFEYARDAKAMPAWGEQLALLAAVVSDEQVRSFLSDTRLTRQQRGDLVLKVSDDQLDANVTNLVKVLNENDRLLALPAILDEFERLRAEYEGTVEATVSSAKALTDAQQKEIAKALEKRLQKKVTLKCEEDPSLIGGAVIKAGDLVIDGSIRTRLNKLSAALSG